MISFVRHGETAHNREGRFQGRADVELSARGLEQVARLATRLSTSEIAAVYSSPLARARQTAMAVAAVAGCEVEADDRLIELDYGEWDGRPLGDIDASEWAAWRADPSFAPPGGESLVAVTARIESFCRERLANPAVTVIAVSHVSPIKAAVCWALNVDERATWQMQLGLATITDIGARSDGSGYLSSFNDAAHLML
ncbi:MAG: alpha-ribazole phosphatase [Actinomycetota bacterium]|jgi:broad specificity phosphatase PhoE|nr:alpha-ribazole phosphatase [Actinomycetota bacterium]